MRCAIYIRVSSAEQRREGYSLPEQRRALEEYAKDNGYTIAGIYADEGISASKKPQRRHEFQRMLRDVEADMIDIIIFIKLDRWFRNVGDYYRTQEILDRHHVLWKSIYEDYDTATRTGKLNLNIKLTIAEDEAANTSERVKFVLDAKVRNKEPNTGMQPFGYKIDTSSDFKRIIKDPDTQAETEDMFEKFFLWKSSYKVARYINETYGRNLSDTTIARRLKNIAYTGEYKGIYEYRPAYITHEQHAEALRIFSGRARKAKGDRVYLFAGLVICPDCGHIMSSCMSNKVTPGYRCKHHYVEDCKNIYTVREDIIEDFILSNISAKLDCYSMHVEAQRAKIKKLSPKKFEEQLERLNNVYVMGNISDEEYSLRSAELKSKIASLRSVNNVPEPIPPDMVKMLSDKDFKDVYEDLSREEKRSLWSSVIERIDVKERKPVAITLVR